MARMLIHRSVALPRRGKEALSLTDGMSGGGGGGGDPGPERTVSARYRANLVGSNKENSSAGLWLV